MILVDTNVIFALADRRDAGHEQCRVWLQELEESETLFIPTTVVTEACYLLDKFLGPEREAEFLDSIGPGEQHDFRLIELTATDISRMAELVRHYADLRLGAADASLVAIAERLGITTIATRNHRDFSVVRPHHVRTLTLIP
jgi:predicted nucleic acid-binding protein